MYKQHNWKVQTLSIKFRDYRSRCKAEKNQEVRILAFPLAKPESTAKEVVFLCLSNPRITGFVIFSRPVALNDHQVIMGVETSAIPAYHLHNSSRKMKRSRNAGEEEPNYTTEALITVLKNYVP